MKRNCFSTTCQFLLPLILLIFILLLRKAFDIENISVTVSDLQFMRSNSSIWPTYPDNPKAVGQADSKFQGLNLRYPFDHCFSSNRTHVGIVRDPAKADLVEINQEIQSSISITSEGLFEYKEFSSIEQLNDYVRDDNYTLTGDFPELCFAYGVGSSSNEGGKRKYTYSLHYYSFRTDQNDEKGFPRDIPSTLFPSLSPFTSSPDLDSHEKWLRSSYMYMVNLISNAIMNKEIDLENSGRGQDSLIPKGRITSGFTAMKFPTYQDDEFAAFIGFLVPFFIVIAYLTPIIIYSFRMVRDKETRLKEGMKIMGMTDLAYFLSYFLQYIIINTVIAFFGAGILLGAFSYIGYVYLFALLWLYGMAIFGLVYFFQALMDKSSIAIILSILIYFIFYFVSSAVVAEDTENISKMFISLLPPTALQLGFTVIARFEISFIALSSDNMKYQYNNYSVANMYLMLFIDTFVYILIGFYLENVLPQQYGTRKKLWFLCTKNYWCSSKKKSAKVENSALKDQEVNHDESNHLSDKRIKKMGEEKSPSDDFQSEEMYLNKKQEGYLKIDQIRKTFDDGKKALNGVSFNLYKDEIFALLGHNGAGKSTLINILSGLFESSGGKAIYNGENILENMDAFHKQIGICPQHDVLFADLSVKEHLELFARFKGITSNVESEILKILTDLELIHKQDELSQNLSGGQKRKLSISIALIGGSEIVFLDEPSSNMDITSRRRLWDILKKFTKNRIIILTTHFMEEASVLGKRIGILSEGKLKCLGTPLFLINRFGKNIALNCIKGRNANDEGIINFVNSIYSKHSNGRSLEYEILTEEILFRIPKNSGDEYKLDYKKFFAELDENTQSIGVRSYSASMPTLEDVFLLVSDEIKKGDGIIQKSSENKDQTNQLKRYKSMDNTVNEFPRTGGFSKFLVDLKWSIIKRDYMAFRNWRVFILEIMCPIILVLIGLGVSSVDFITDAPLKNMTLSEYQFLQESLVNRNPYYSRSENIEISGLEAVDRQKFVFEAETAEASLAAQLVSFNNRVLQKYNATRTENPVFNDSSTNSYLGAYYFLDFNKSSNIYEFVTFANIKSRNSQPIMTQAMINAIISQAVGKEIDIIQQNQPFPLTNYQKSRTQTRNTGNLVFFIAIGFALIPASFVTSIIRERECTKHLQIVSGISLVAFWLANFIFELLKYYFTGGICLLIIFGFDKFPDGLWILYLLYGYSMVPLTYLVSFFFTSESSAQNTIIGIYFVIGALAGSALFILRILEDLIDIAKIISYVLRVVPLYAFSYGYSSLLNKDLLFFIDYKAAAFFIEIDMLSLEYVGMDILYMGATGTLYILLLIVVEYFYSKHSFNKFQPNKPLKEGIEDEEVLREIEKANSIENPDAEKNPTEYSLVVQNVEKTYSSCCGRTVKAIQNVNFCLEYGDCFALLGLNGAGKTSLFKCLTNQIFPEKGMIMINGRKISTDFESVRNLIGYCPQIDSIFEELTVEENLKFYAHIKGCPSERVQETIETIMKDMNLFSYIKKKSGELSGGNKRKLSVAIAMIGNPPIILLDEPSAGMDPEARRYMWAVIHRITKMSKKSSVVLTTHSMEEAETLCQKMGILVQGKFRCIGSANVIKDNYGTGFEIFLTFKPLSHNELSSQMTGLNLTADQQLTLDRVDGILAKVGSRLSSDLIRKDHIGCELHEDLQMYGAMTAGDLLQWNHYISNLFRTIKDLLDLFDEVTIAEYWENTFTLKFKRNERLSIGYLFGYFDDIKERNGINEYSITQTSIEQIFNSFAHEMDLKQGYGENHKPELKIGKDFINNFV